MVIISWHYSNIVIGENIGMATGPGSIGNNSISGKTAWTGTGKDDFGKYDLVEKKGVKKGKKGSKRQILVTYKPGGFSCK